MGLYRFVDPTIERLPLAAGDDWIDVKGELNAGEQRDVFAGMVKEQRAGEQPLLDSRRVGLTRLAGYILGWSFTDREGKPIKVTESAINRLDSKTYRELNDLLDAHVARVEAAREERKNDQDGEKESSAISPSPVAVAGALNGSVN